VLRFLVAEMAQLLKRDGIGQVRGHLALADQRVVQPRPTALEREPLAELVEEHLRALAADHLHGRLDRALQGEGRGHRSKGIRDRDVLPPQPRERVRIAFRRGIGELRHFLHLLLLRRRHLHAGAIHADLGPVFHGLRLP
jgi:hypothetical protein